MLYLCDPQPRRILKMKKKRDLTLHEHLQAIQPLGGKARWAGLSPEERSLAARKAVEARWARKKALESASAPLEEGDLEPRVKTST